MKKTCSILATVFLIMPFLLFSQYEKEWFKQLSEEEHKQVEALAMYPEDTRLAILEASSEPQALVKLKRIQQQTSASFNRLVSAYSEEDQKAIWDLVRYPGLVESMAGKNSDDRKAVLDNYPEVIHQRANQIADKYPELLVEIRDLQQNADVTFAAVLSNYPDRISAPLQHLIELPEVLTILAENVEMTMVVGELYKKDPEWVLQKADSVHLVLARQQAQELEDWKTETANNPAAAEEMQATARNFEAEYNYDDDYYDYDDAYDEPEDEYETRVVVRHYYHHYPYWFGYPTWYVYPRWRPVPWWHEWGFYVRPGGRIVIMSLPSYYCVNWYFYHGIHHYHHPHFSAHLVNHYHGHRTSPGSISSGVRHWRNANRDIVDDNWINRKEGRAERFKEYGKFEKDRKSYNDRKSGKAVSKQEYLSKNKRKYPALKGQKKPEVVAPARSGKKPVAKPDRKPTKEPVYKPTKKPVYKPTKEPARKPTKQPVYKPTKKPDSKPKKPVVVPKKKKEKPTKQVKKPSIRKVKKAQDYHQDKWQKPARKVTPQARPKTQTKRTPVKKKPTSRKRKF